MSIHHPNSVGQNRYISHLISKSNLPEVVAITYNKAQSTIHRLFSSPIGARIEEVDLVVDEIVSNIVEDKAAISSLNRVLSHDYYTHTHSVNVSIYAALFAKYKGMPRDKILRIAKAGILHDIGKSDIDPSIINKPGRLTEFEFLKMKLHPSRGYEIALALGVKDTYVLSGIRYHHERLDGSGYPDHLACEEIPDVARIVAICDFFDALTTRRSYKPALSTLEALRVMTQDAKRHIDPGLLKDFITMMGEGATK